MKRTVFLVFTAMFLIGGIVYATSSGNNNSVFANSSIDKFDKDPKGECNNKKENSECCDKAASDKRDKGCKDTRNSGSDCNKAESKKANTTCCDTRKAMANSDLCTSNTESKNRSKRDCPPR